MRLLKRTGTAVPSSEHRFYQHQLDALKLEQSSVCAQETLKLLHSKYWLQCNCTEHDINAPALTVRANPNKTYSLVNISGRGEHRNGCTLSYEKLENKALQKKKAPFDITMPSDKQSLFLLVNMLIDQAKINLISDLSSYNENKALITSTGTKNITINGQLLKTIFHFGFRSFFSIRDNPSDKGDLIFEVVDDIVEKNGTVSLMSTNKEKPIFNLFRNITDIHITPDPAPCVTNAFIVLAFIGKNPKTKAKTTLSPISAIILPVVSKHHWITPTHTHYRKMIQSLLNAQKWYKKNKDLDFIISAPTLPIITNIGVGKPDFMIMNQDKIQIINLLPDKSTNENLGHMKCIDILKDIGPVTEFSFSMMESEADYFYDQNKAIFSAIYQ